MNETAHSEDILLTVPDFSLADSIYILESRHSNDIEKKRAQEEILEKIKMYNMGSLYKILCEDKKLMDLDKSLIKSLEEKNNQKLDIINAKIKDAEDNCGDLEVRTAHYSKTIHFVRIGDKQKSLEELEISYQKTIGSGYKLELLFLGIRIGLFWHDSKIANSYMKRAEDELAKAGDWERKNRLKVYQALSKLVSRDFNGASQIFLDCLTTFTAVEILTFDQLIFYTVISSVLTVGRTIIKSKLLASPEILKIALQPDQHFLLEFIECLYYGKYSRFYSILVNIVYLLQKDRYLHLHHRYYLRNIRLRAYKQYLEPFESVTLSEMSKSFGLSTNFLEDDIVSFISSSKLPCKIDKVRGIILCNTADEKLSTYNEIIHKGDTLLNRLQKLSRVIQV
ncbi:PCI domain-containing protein [Cryptosporidium andersoni]|uniref:PCI domain-containing protein n=1 Tax=Cryptosporidium andersoni TaxID=117008 RepID=A0A1J4MEZ9_9CRYT|nr:PCI domain-containing protein [Cryptosporidium andersoni]